MVKIIKCYKQNRLHKLNKYLKGYRKLEIKQVIELACLGKKSDGKMHGHQFRIKKVALAQVSETLLKKANVAAISKCKNFESLYNLIDKKRAYGFANLCIYDTALRIGFYRRIYPQKVYLHRGTKVGAKSLKLNTTNGCITMNELIKKSRAFNLLNPYQIEDLLCVCKKDLKVGRITGSMLRKCGIDSGC